MSNEGTPETGILDAIITCVTESPVPLSSREIAEQLGYSWMQVASALPSLVTDGKIRLLDESDGFDPPCYEFPDPHSTASVKPEMET